MSILGKEPLDGSGSVLYSEISVRWSDGSTKDSRERAMQLNSSYFAFTYRFSFTGERAGETRADEVGS